eukprot:537787-Alexandrium_andersonii.AAC.1
MGSRTVNLFLTSGLRASPTPARSLYPLLSGGGQDVKGVIYDVLRGSRRLGLKERRGLHLVPVHDLRDPMAHRGLEKARQVANAIPR